GREDTVGSFFTSSYSAPLLFTTCIVGIATLAMRKRALAALDRQFFREEYDSELVLTNLLPKLSTASSASDLALLLEREIDKTVNPVSVVILIRSARREEFAPVG